jgi:pyruvate,water dikinase
MKHAAVQTKFEGQANPTTIAQIAQGRAASPGVAVGPCRVITRRQDLGSVKKNEILICRKAIPHLALYMGQMKGLVTENGGALTIAASYARECDVPHVAGVNDVMASVINGQIIQIDGSKGIISLL